MGGRIWGVEGWKGRPSCEFGCCPSDGEPPKVDRSSRQGLVFCVNQPGEWGRSEDLGLGGNSEVVEKNPKGRSLGSQCQNWVTNHAES